MGAIQPRPECMVSLEKCIDAMCAEQSKSTSVIQWFQRMSESTALDQLEENLFNGTTGSYYETQSRVLGSVQHGKTSWASDQTFSDAWSHKYSNAEQKALFRQDVAQRYLSDHPDDCRPPQQPQPTRSRQRVSSQLPLFEPGAFAFSTLPMYSFDEFDLTGWIVGAGIAAAVAEEASAAAGATAGFLEELFIDGLSIGEGAALFLSTIGLRYQFDDKKHPDLS